MNSALATIPLLLIISLPQSLLAADTPSPKKPSPTFAIAIKPFLQTHCLKCHGPKKQKSGIRFDQISAYQHKNRQLWTKVHQALVNNEMPPDDRPQPSAKSKSQILSWIQTQQRLSDTAQTRRLNRRELSASLQHLTGLNIDYAAALPEDGKVEGFDTVSQALNDTADSVTQLMNVSRRAVSAIRFLDPPSGQIFTADFRTVKDARKALDPWKKQGAYVKPRGQIIRGQGILIEPKWVGDRGGFSFNIPPPPNGKGVIRIQFTVASIKGNFTGIPDPHLWVKVAGKTIAYQPITNTIQNPKTYTYLVQLNDLAIESRGVGITLTNRVEQPYAIKGFKNEDRSKPQDKIAGGTGLFRPAWDRKNRKLTYDQKPIPYILLQNLRIDSHYVATWPPTDKNKPNAAPEKLTDSSQTAERLLSLWISRAYRRPVTPAERAPYLGLYKKLRKQNHSFDTSLRAAFQAVLLSGPSRFLASPADKNKTIAQYAIASRLSFMLTGAPPDPELQRLAAASKLRDPSTLNAQVDRLLKSPKAANFFNPFVTQWLVIGQPITLAMTNIKNQDFRFGRHLKASMRAETIQYIRQLFTQNKPAAQLVHSDWTMMNNILAHHYGYKNITGSYLRPVKIKPNDPRGGGILGHAGIQSMLTWMGDNWVIYRGAWTLGHILDDPPPPPPLEVPELNPSEGKNRGKTFRQLLNQHQADPNCSVCHKKMDPLGFAFQNFDLSGRWRTREYEKYHRYQLDGKIEWRGVGKSRPVDALGSLPRGEKFSSFAQAKKLISTHYLPDLTRGIMKNLILYGAHRQPNIADLQYINAEIAKQKSNNYRLGDILKAFVRSPAFLDY